MKLFINIILLLIIVMCTWRGYKKGFVSGIIGILIIVVAVYGGSLLSSKYSKEIIPVLDPFVDGYVDSQKTRDDALASMGYADTDLSLDDVLAQDSSLRYDYAYECMSGLGFTDGLSEELAAKAVDKAETTGIHMKDAVVKVLCETVSYVGGLLLAFLLILILLVTITSIGNITFKFPKMPMLDYAGGAVLGFAKGFLYCVLLCWLLSFAGIVIGADTLENSFMARIFLSFDFITRNLL